MLTSLPKSLAPARAPLTMSRLIADAKMMMKIVDNKKYAISVHRAAASRITSSMLATRTFMRALAAPRHLAQSTNQIDKASSESIEPARARSERRLVRGVDRSTRSGAADRSIDSSMCPLTRSAWNCASIASSIPVAITLYFAVCRVRSSTRPAATTFPERRTATRSQVISISDSRCEFTRMAVPFSPRREEDRGSRGGRPDRRRRSARRAAARSENGSARLARPRRCVIPFENFLTRTSIHCAMLSFSRSSMLRLDRRGVEARHPPEDRQRLPRGQIARDLVSLREIADAAAALRIGDRQAGDAHGAGRRSGKAQKDLDGGGLAGAVRAEEPEHLPLHESRARCRRAR